MPAVIGSPHNVGRKPTPRVLLIFEYASLNGGEHSLLCLLPLLQQAGIEFIAAAPATGPLAMELRAIGIDTIRFEPNDSHGHRLTQLDRREQLRAIIAQAKPTLIHANSLAMTRLSGPVAQQAGIASVGHIRDIVGLSKQAVRDCNCHTRLVAVSHATRQWHIAGGMQAERIEVAYNGVDLEQFQPRSSGGWLRKQLDLKPSARLLGGVGQIGMRKGWDTLLAALQQIDMESYDCHAVIAGERHSTKQEALEYEQALRETAASGALKGRIHFIGRVAEMAAFYSDLDLLVHPPRQEPLGRVLLEAGACGLPVIATSVGGTEEIFPAEARAGLLIEQNAPAVLAAAIQQYLSDQAVFQEYGQRARHVMEREFSRFTATKRLLEIYRSVAG